jgi:hypothetical protein
MRFLSGTFLSLFTLFSAMTAYGTEGDEFSHLRQLFAYATASEDFLQSLSSVPIHVGKGVQPNSTFMKEFTDLTKEIEQQMKEHYETPIDSTRGMRHQFYLMLNAYALEVIEATPLASFVTLLDPSRTVQLKNCTKYLEHSSADRSATAEKTLRRMAYHIDHHTNFPSE